MSRVMHQLKTDHVNITKLLDLLDDQMRRFDEGGSPDYDLMLDVMDYTMNYPDLCHHPKEDLVFRKLLERDPAGSRAVVEQLFEEHRALTTMTKEFARALGRVVLDAELSREQIGKLAHDYIEANRRHIATEENVAFPLAVEALREEDWTEIEAVLNGDDPLFGSAVQQQYRSLHESIVNIPPAL